ncbi:hypothetical protein Pfo_023663 [Paulownia fortunei]|nr:hypothetical protein Pfo_023663 [Paulownia fortunei]
MFLVSVTCLLYTSRWYYLYIDQVSFYQNSNLRVEKPPAEETDVGRIMKQVSGFRAMFVKLAVLVAVNLCFVVCSTLNVCENPR